MRSPVLPLSSLYREAAVFTLLQQIPCALLGLLLLDGGRMARVCGIAMIGYWAAAAYLMARWPGSPRPGDLAFLRWGFLPLLAAALLGAQLL